MPFDNLGRKHFTETQLDTLQTALQTVLDQISDMSENLSPKERSRYGKVGDQKELLIDKVRDYHESDSANSAPDVDWDAFLLDYNDRKSASQLLAITRSIEYTLMNIKILADHNNYQASLTDYQYANYRNRLATGSVFSKKIDEMKVFFPKTGKTGTTKKKD